MLVCLLRGVQEIANSYVDQQQSPKERRDVIARDERRLSIKMYLPVLLSKFRTYIFVKKIHQSWSALASLAGQFCLV